MPKRTDIHNILIIGSGPIVIGQGAEFDYSGTQGCKALREEGYSVVLVNSNPATIMTDPEMADRTYVEPITPEFIEKILIRERRDGRPVHALLPTLGGQTGLNCAMECHECGILEKYGVRMIGATPEAIHKAEDRTAFKETMLGIGLDVPRSGIAHTWDEAKAVLERIQLPCCIRPGYTLGGEGGGFCRTMEEFETIARRGLAASRVSEILIEESLYGWKEFELEVMRDRADNVVIICSIENLDPMGVHTGDSITVAPIQTLTDKEYQKMRDSAVAIMRAIGVDTGGCNVQFAVEPATGRQCVVEMNPRVSRSSALASKATGYPIARIAAKLAVGYTLDELPNDITRTTPASFEPTIDYVVVKIPRWTFEKFPDCDETLTTQMKSVGEAMAIGRTFKEAFQKCIRSMEIQRYGFGLDANDAWLKAHGDGCAEGPHRQDSANRQSAIDNRQSNVQALDSAANIPLGGATATEAPPDTEEEHAQSWPIPRDVLRDKLGRPCQGRPYYIRYAFKMGWSVEQVHELTRIDPWFLEQMRELVDQEDELLRAAGVIPRANAGVDRPSPRDPVALESHSDPLRRAKQHAYSNVQLASAMGKDVAEVVDSLRRDDVRASYRLVDTCAAEFEAQTPYYYSTHETPVWTLAEAAGEVETDGAVEKPRFDQKPQFDQSRDRKGAVVHRSSGTIEGSLPARCGSDQALQTPSGTLTVASSPRGLKPADQDEIRVSDKPKIVILGGGPNRIGQGIEFDYCCCHASFASRKAGFESVMVNSNPETVSTDFDTSDLLFFEPLTHEDVLNVVERLNGQPLNKGDMGTKPRGDKRGAASAGSVVPSSIDNRQSATSSGLVRGVIVQFGGQTPLNLAQGLKDSGVPILGTQPEMIHLAEDREQFARVLRELSLLQPPSGIARSSNDARTIAQRIGYPVLVRPSYVMGGRGMKVCNNQTDLEEFLNQAFSASDRLAAADDNPILIDKFLVDAIEVDVDAVADFGRPADTPDDPSPTCMVAGIMEHIEEAGIHSGDSTAVLPPFSLGRLVTEELFRSTKRLARRLKVHGAMNIQYAVLNRTVYVLEVNPRASRTLPFVAKATGIPWAEVATRVMLGESLTTILDEHGIHETPWPRHTSIKAPVFPFHKFPGVDVILGPEMRSTGEVMAIAETFGQAFAKAQIATGFPLPTSGNALVSVNDPDKPRIVSIARDLHDLGFTIFSTTGTRTVLAEAGIPSTLVSKSSDSGDAPFLKDLIAEGTLHLLINTPIRTGPAWAEGRWRAAANARRVPLITTLAGARAAVAAIRALSRNDDGAEPLPLDVKPLQAYFHVG
ncbi:MAG: carbamoyl-phosphate synthase large subunit [Planctomycetota bacterium]